MHSRLEQILARKDRILKRVVICPKCSTDQVQVVEYIYSPARYKCRVCKFKFINEPISP